VPPAEHVIDPQLLAIPVAVESMFVAVIARVRPCGPVWTCAVGFGWVAAGSEEPVLVPMSDTGRAAAVSVPAEIFTDWWTRHAGNDRIGA
jgi:hypothetical protein